MASTAKRLLDQLSNPGPHDVLRGDLALVGLPGIVFTPRAGLNLPAVSFGHGWLQSPGRYRGLLRHLASWGVVAAAPATHRGLFPSHRLFAADLRSTLDLVTNLRLGADGISVDPDRLGLAGHSIGGGAAVLAASNATPSMVRAVATIGAAQTMPSATTAALTVTAPGLHLTGDDDLLAPAAGNAEAISQAWAGPVQLRSIPKMTHLGITEGTHWSQVLLHGRPQHTVQRRVRALLTAFFLAELTGADTYRELLDTDLKAARVTHDSRASQVGKGA